MAFFISAFGKEPRAWSCAGRPTLLAANLLWVDPPMSDASAAGAGATEGSNVDDDNAGNNESEMVDLHRYQIDLEVRSQLLFEKYMALPPPSVQPRGLMGKDKLALLMRDVGVLQLVDDDKAAVLQELELSDVDEDCLLNFAEFVTFVRYLSQRPTINAAVLQIVHDEYQEARRRTVFRNFCETELRLGQRGLVNFLKELKVFKLLNKFDRTMCWTASTVTRPGADEYIPFRNFVSTTVPMIAAKVFGATAAAKPGSGGGGGTATAASGSAATTTSEAIARVWELVDQAYIHLCKHAERRNVLVQLLSHEEKLLMRAFVGVESVVDLDDVGRCLDQMRHTDRAPALAQLVADIRAEMCGPGSSEVLFVEFVALVPHRFVSALKTGCIISLNPPKPPSLERSAMHPRGE